MADLLFFKDDTFGESDTVYEGPSLAEVAMIRDSLGWNLKKAARRLNNKMKCQNLREIFPNRRDHEKEFQQLLTDLGVELAPILEQVKKLGED